MAARRNALVLAPQGRDGAIAAALLAECGLASTECVSVEQVVDRLDNEVVLALCTEETLKTADLRAIAAWVRGQPSWSDLPFMVITHKGGAMEPNPHAARIAEVLGNVSFLERPFHATTFLSVVRSAMRARERQYEARARMDALHESDERLRQLNETLEQRVAVRSAELQQAHASVLEQITQREKAEEQLRQAQKMELVGQLTGGVAHDFNNLLMVVLTNLELVRRRCPGDQLTEQLIEAAVRSARRGAVLTQRLLAFSRRQELTIAGFDLAVLLRGMSDLLERSVGPSVELEMVLPENLPPGLVDGNQLELALLNLVVNARDAMPDGGSVTIEVRAQDPDAALSLPPGRYVCLSVTDTGQGMDAATLKRATEPFFSTKERGKGTGLGLSMIHGLAMQLSGALRLESELGKGTRAEMWLPVAPAVAASLEAVPRPEVSSSLSPLNVLLVDDDELISQSTRGMLEALGHHVMAAGSGAEALRLINEDHAFDLMITDYAMPHMTGAQLAQHVRGRRPQLPILLATGYAEFPGGAGEDLPRLNKPYEQHQLAAEIARVLDGRVAAH